MQSLVLSKKDPPIGAALSCGVLGVAYEWRGETQLVLDDSISLTNSQAISRHLARLHPDSNLYPSHILHRTGVDHWLGIANKLRHGNSAASDLTDLDAVLSNCHCLVPPNFTIADFEIFGVLYCSSEWQQRVQSGSAPSHVLRWYRAVCQKYSGTLSALPVEVRQAVPCAEEEEEGEECPGASVAAPSTSVSGASSSGAQRKAKAPAKPRQPADKGRKEEGKFVELPGARKGEVVVRFPPEASGYLHIGHAKAALLNQHYQLAFEGKLIMRFDDTNPAKENEHFENVILEDLKLMEIKPDRFTHTSDYFDLMIEKCEQMIKEGFAYVDDTDAETMKAERDERKESKNRSNDAAKNLKMWEQMKKGEEYGLKCCVRAKIDMKSNNGCMRDPTIYRCKLEPHIKTGDKYKVYPTYDFACPIVDSIEGVTHALRTTEYHDRDEQFFWFLEKLKLRKLHVYEYSRLNMNNTVLSKRKLAWFVEQGLVDGWDDPRFPTVRGILRRGMTVQGLKEFIIAQGSSRSVVNMEWDKIWTFNKKVIDAVAPRYVALERDSLVPVHVTNAEEKATTAAKHPKDPSIGTKTVWVGPKVLIESVDAELLKEGEKATFINWGNLTIKKIYKEGGKVVKIDAETALDDTNYKKTLKLTWLPDSEQDSAELTPVTAVEFDHLVNKGVLGKDEDFKTYVGHQTRFETHMLGDFALRSLKKGDIVQLQRKGFYIVDKEYQEADLATCKQSPIVMFFIPDGHTKAASTAEPATGKKSVSFNEKLVQEGSGAAVKVEAAQKSNDGAAAYDLLLKIKEQGDKIRDLKAAKSSKDLVFAEVNELLKLKEKFKALTGKLWLPELLEEYKPKAAVESGSSAQTVQESNSSCPIYDVLLKIKGKGDDIRSLKAAKAGKDKVSAEVAILLNLKEEFKTLSGKLWTPDIKLEDYKPKKEVNTGSSESSAAYDLLVKIKEQGDKVRDLKAAKSNKDLVFAEVNELLKLKEKFKALTGKLWLPELLEEYKPKAAVESGSSAPTVQESSSSCPIYDVLLKIKEKGDEIRSLKSAKAAKETIMAQVEVLKELKAKFKELSGKEWTPTLDISSYKPASTVAAPAVKIVEVAKEVGAPSSDAGSPYDLLMKIKDQGDKIRQMKSAKADKNDVMSEVDTLKSLKTQFETVSGKKWTPDIDVNAFKTSSASSSSPISEQHLKIKQQGDVIRELKASKAAKEKIESEVAVLKKLKAEFKTLSGVEWTPQIDVSKLQSTVAATGDNAKAAPALSTAKASAKPKDVKKQLVKESKVDDSKKQTRLGLESKKSENLSDWYSQIITKSEMIEYYNVSGCYILLPWSYGIWEYIKDYIDEFIKSQGVENTYFPIFVSRDVLEKEKEHIADFSPEVAWVTRSGNTEMAEPIAIRPTSETVMYPTIAKRIQSHRDLPMKLNQWNNVVRWEFKQPTPFLRTREFLWQEGHSAFQTKSEACTEVYTILDMYARVYQDLLAIPVVKGKKTEKEKFAGGDFTTTTEAFVSANGRAIQGATSHHLGQNFSKMFNIVFEDPNTKEKEFAYQNSWGMTTRTIGVMVMVHGDDKGLVLPPKVAKYQAVVMPVGTTSKLSEHEKNALYDQCAKLTAELKASGVRAYADLRDDKTPSWKFNHWELKGVPLRMEIGPKESAAGMVCVVRRDDGSKQSVPQKNIAPSIAALLSTVQDDMFAKASNELNSHKKLVHTWDDFCGKLDEGNLLLAPFCGVPACEDKIKNDSARDRDTEAGAPSMGAKSLCIPFEQPQALPAGAKCVYPACCKQATYYTMFGRSY